MYLGVSRNNRVANRSMATRAVAVHANHGAVIHSGMIADKGTMTGRTVIRATARGALFARCRADEDPAYPMALGAIIMNLIVCEACRDA